jgi:histidyl-tRNA synthetase
MRHLIRERKTSRVGPREQQSSSRPLIIEIGDEGFFYEQLAGEAIVKKRIERLRGMHDLLPDAYQQQHWLMDRLGAFLAQAGYDAVDSPVLEESDLFQMSFGQELWQNLYTFRLHHRDLCLRPEYTASMCRLYLDHYQRQPLPLRFQYAGPVFRYEAPGRGRYRQHTQLGIELFGGQAATADAEMLRLACDALDELQITAYKLELGHIGVASGFINRLHLDDHAARLLLGLMEQISRSAEGEQMAQARIEALYPTYQATDDAGYSSSMSEIEAKLIAPLLSGISISFGDDDARHEIVERFLWKMERSEQRRQILDALEFLRMLHTISGPPPGVFEALRDLLGRYQLDPGPLTELEQLVTIIEQSGVPRQQILLNLALGRGVSYYTGLVFEIHAQDEEGFDAQLCGGGRYDRLVRAVGSTRDVNACGFAFGIERLLSLIPPRELPRAAGTKALVIPVSDQDLQYALQVARTVRTHGARVEVDVSGHGVGAGLRQAAKKQIRYALIVGEDEQQANMVTLRDLVTAAEEILDTEAVVRSIAGEEGEQ